MKSMQRVLAIVLTALALATLAGSATAENGHVYHGSYCKAFSGSQAADFIHGTTGTFNRASEARFVICPVLVDEVDNTDGTTQVWVHWSANVNAPNDTITCGLNSAREDGGTAQSHTVRKTGTGRFILPNVTSEDTSTSYFILCSLPSQGTINTIWLGEND
jgi:hypothetical protein